MICDECTRAERERKILIVAMQAHLQNSKPADLVMYVAYHDCREYSRVTALPSHNVYMAAIELKAATDQLRLEKEQKDIFLAAMAQKQLARWH